MGSLVPRMGTLLSQVVNSSLFGSETLRILAARCLMQLAHIHAETLDFALQIIIQLGLRTACCRANLPGRESYRAAQIGTLQIRTTHVRTAQNGSLQVSAA